MFPTQEEAQSPVMRNNSERDQGNETKVTCSEDLFTSAGLRPSYRDLDQIFDNSDSSSDEIVRVVLLVTSMRL